MALWQAPTLLAGRFSIFATAGALPDQVMSNGFADHFFSAAVQFTTTVIDLFAGCSTWAGMRNRPSLLTSNHALGPPAIRESKRV